MDRFVVLLVEIGLVVNGEFVILGVEISYILIIIKDE